MDDDKLIRIIGSVAAIILIVASLVGYGITGSDRWLLIVLIIFGFANLADW